MVDRNDATDQRRTREQQRAIERLERGPSFDQSLEDHRAAPKTRDLLCCGQIRTCTNLSAYEKAFLFLAVILFAFLILLMSRKVIKLVPLVVDVKTKDANKPDFTLCILLLWTALWGFYHAVFGILCEQFLDLVTYVASLAVFVTYIICDYLESTSADPVQKVFVVAFFICILLILLGIYYTKKFYKTMTNDEVPGKYIYAIYGARAGPQLKYKQIHIFGALTKLDIQLSTSAIVLWLQAGFIDYDFDDMEFMFVALAALETILWYSFGYFAVKHESRVLMYLFYMVSFVEPSAIMYNVYKTYLKSDEIQNSLEIATFICSFLALLVRVLANISMYQVSKHFNTAEPAEQTEATRFPPSTEYGTSTEGTNP
ncbi:hypothetical protein HDE_03627 [Halotydeus destructor]|nr:hypothetical protein HDE_03627 [Halotydeus destructor]